MKNDIEKAYRIAKTAHKGQFDKGGNDYINHPLAVADMLSDENEKIVALLHDVVEDTDITLPDLRKQGFSKQIVQAVDCITKRPKEPLKEYLYRVKNNPLARAVKIADLTHNSDISRIPSPTKKDFSRTERYKSELEFLRADSDVDFTG